MKVKMTYTREESRKYLPYYSDVPPRSKGLTEVVDYCGRNKLQLIVGYINAHPLYGGEQTNHEENA